ncbi:ABC transporter permease [Microtetraspora malaysiensis]|uniref:ABC transporter permease n=1 Tax=Microtetraspora malaysiensis TaxID=161358 RepID=UPI003D8FFA41
MSALAVLLGVAFVVGSLIYTQSLEAAMDEARAESRPDLSVEVRRDFSPSSDSARLDEALLRRLAALPEVAAARGAAEGRSFLVGSDGTLVGSLVDAAGVNYVPGEGDADPRYPLTTGRGPRGDGEIAVDAHSAERAGYRIGEHVRIVVNGTARDVRLVGVFDARDERLAADGTLTAFDTATAQRQFANAPGAYTSIGLTAAPGTSETRLAQRAQALLPPGLEAVTRSHLDAETVPGEEKLTMLLLSFAGVALFVSTFLIANTFTMLSAARAREHAILRAIGATRSYVTHLVLAEAVLVGVLASAAGYASGVGVAAVMNALFGATGDVPTPLRPFTAGPPLAALVVGVGVTALSAYIPARRAAAVPPVAALRAERPAAARASHRRGVAGLAVTGLGAALTLAAMDAEDLFLAAVPILLVGLIMVTPWLAERTARLLRSPLTRLAGVRGTLAVENARRNPRRTAATATALMIGLALVCVVTVIVSSLSRTAEREAESAMLTDLRIVPVDFAEIGDDAAGRVAALPGAAAVIPLVNASIRLTGDGFVSVVAVDPAAVARLALLDVRQGSLDGLARGIAVSEQTAAAHGWSVGSRVTGAFARGDRKVDLPVVAVYSGPEALTPALISTVSLPEASGAVGRPSVGSILIKAEPGRTARLQQDIRRALANPALLVQNRDDVVKEAVRPFAPILAIMYALLSVTVLIGALGVINTMSMAVFERVREIGVLRAVGLDRRGVRVVLRLEAAVISLLGAVLGLVAGALVGAAVVAAHDGALLVMPWDRLALLFAATVAIGVLASTLPGRRAARIPVLRALRSDIE